MLLTLLYLHLKLLGQLRLLERALLIENFFPCLNRPSHIQLYGLYTGILSQNIRLYVFLLLHFFLLVDLSEDLSLLGLLLPLSLSLDPHLLVFQRLLHLEPDVLFQLMFNELLLPRDLRLFLLQSDVLEVLLFQLGTPPRFFELSRLALLPLDQLQLYFLDVALNLVTLRLQRRFPFDSRLFKFLLHLLSLNGVLLRLRCVLLLLHLDELMVSLGHLLLSFLL